MENNIKNRAFQWIKLELAYDLYGTQNFDGTFNRNYLGEYEVHGDGAYIYMEGLNCNKKEYISGTREYLVLQKYEKIPQEDINYRFKKMEEILNQYELPKDITDVLILKLTK